MPPSTTPAETVLNLCSASAGARILFATDEWFAAADRLLQDTPPVLDPRAYCPQGKVMDGWESRRRREPGHDWCLIQLSQRAATLQRVELDTAYFTGNQAPAVSIQATDLSDCTAEAELVSALPRATRRLLLQGRPGYDMDVYRGTGATPAEVAAAEAACGRCTWHELLPRQPLQPGYDATRHHAFSLTSSNGLPATHIRLNYFPDGGVARLRLYGVPVADANDTIRLPPQPLYMPIVTGRTCTVVSYDDPDATMPSQIADADASLMQISCVEHGGTAVFGTNQHYGTPANLLQRKAGVDMGDGWETARQPQRPPMLVAGPNGLVDFGDWNEYCILRLGQCVAQVSKLILDTKHFKGNYPESVEVHGCYLEKDDADAVEDWKDRVDWFPLIPRVRLSPHAEHCFDAALGQLPQRTSAPGVSHVRVRIFPDGGLSRVRVYGPVTKS